MHDRNESYYLLISSDTGIHRRIREEFRDKYSGSFEEAHGEKRRLLQYYNLPSDAIEVRMR